ncbi:histidine phosphatase family protein [Moraxella sp. RCAD0137]|uniref:histidine phosphatase family protein n=1 Tax=Moraxella sp. RCAD0137 TaxID=1775913 RepID=UPI000C9F5568|nr:histidine phosphatase family protein [Moraxella sp. RCAD0137]PNP98272.1 hypothetical protein AZ602_03555 [Moraxella sp. RCAD0137]
MADEQPSLVLSFLRHGETELLTQGLVLRGRLDDPLILQGEQQMHTAIDTALPKQSWQAIISSPLSRCAKIAKQKSVQYGLPIVLMDELCEMDFGDWEGRFTAELFEQYPDDMALWWQSPTKFTPPDGESMADFAKRIDTALFKIKQFAQANHYDKLCIISHGGVIKYLYCKAQDLSLDEILKQPAELGEFHTFILQNNRLLLP